MRFFHFISLKPIAAWKPILFLVGGAMSCYFPSLFFRNGSQHKNPKWIISRSMEKKNNSLLNPIPSITTTLPSLGTSPCRSMTVPHRVPTEHQPPLATGFSRKVPDLGEVVVSQPWFGGENGSHRNAGSFKCQLSFHEDQEKNQMAQCPSCIWCFCFRHTFCLKMFDPKKVWCFLLGRSWNTQHP